MNPDSQEEVGPFEAPNEAQKTKPLWRKMGPQNVTDTSSVDEPLLTRPASRITIDFADVSLPLFLQSPSYAVLLSFENTMFRCCCPCGFQVEARSQLGPAAPSSTRIPV